MREPNFHEDRRFKITTITTHAETISTTSSNGSTNPKLTPRPTLASLLLSPRNMGSVVSLVDVVCTDVAGTDVARLGSDVAGLGSEVAGLGSDVAGLGSDVTGLG